MKLDKSFSWQQKSVYLASTSPRRHELLKQMGMTVLPLPVDIDESSLPGEDPKQYVSRIALAKLQDACQNKTANKKFPIICADTCVVIDGLIFGKPQDKAAVIFMLQKLSAVKHQVMTQVCCYYNGKYFEAFSQTDIWFREILLDEIEAYFATGEPLGKAGSYALQGIGACFVSRIEGSYSGVIGLPIFETSQMLREVFES